jgi:lipoprotein-anchoring transpeptidase ErfK/SrfK
MSVVAAVPVADEPPVPPATTPLPTYAPTAFVSRVVTTLAPMSSPASSPVAATPVAPVADTTTTLPPTAPPSVPPTTRPSAPPPSLVARVLGPTIDVYASRTDTWAAFALLGTSEFGGPRVFLATALEGEWVQVSLPLRPNGSEGYVRATDVQISEVNDAITVDRATRTLRWTRNGEELLETYVAIGAPASPTPAGRFHVTDLVPEDPRGPYGAWALALNGYSESFVTFDGGDPRLAIHGTNQPSSIGRASSNGCVRVNADDLASLAAEVPLGTPVIIT